MEKKKILLVDDEPDILKVIGTMIEKWGYDVLKAKNGKEAIEVVKTQKPDVIVLDYKLPDKDGVAVLKQIRSIDQKLPVIMFTAYPNEPVMEETQKLGICAFVPKVTTQGEIGPFLKSAIHMAERSLEEKA